MRVDTLGADCLVREEVMKDMAKISAKEVFRGKEYSSVFCGAEYELPGKADTESHMGWECSRRFEIRANKYFGQEALL